MSYWGPGAEESDFAFDAVGVSILLIKRKLLEDTKTVLDEKYPEQAIVAHLTCLRLLGERFPKNLMVHFGRRDFEAAKRSFNEWYELVQRRLPKQVREELREEAEAEFQRFEQFLDKAF